MTDGQAHAQALVAALGVFRSKDGHFPRCGHGNWLRGFDNVQLHDCARPGCNGWGVPCSGTCLRANQVLEAAERWLIERRLGQDALPLEVKS